MESKHKVERDCQLDRLNAELRLYRITVLILSVILMACILLFGIMFLEDGHMGLCSGTVILTGDSDVSMICLQVMGSNISPGVWSDTLVSSVLIKRFGSRHLYIFSIFYSKVFRPISRENNCNHRILTLGIGNYSKAQNASQLLFPHRVVTLRCAITIGSIKICFAW